MNSRVVPLTGVKLEPPAPTKGWLVATKSAWGRFWDSDLAGAVNHADLPTLSYLFELCDERQRLMNAYKRHRMVKGSKGQVRVNPCLTQALQLDKEIAVLEMRFGITPLGRSRLGLQFGREQKTIDELNLEMNHPQEETDDDPRIIDIGEAKAT